MGVFLELISPTFNHTPRVETVLLRLDIGRVRTRLEGTFRKGARMKKTITMLALLVLVSGCSWFGHGDGATVNYGGTVGGADYSPARGTTGVSSGADAGQGITGSDAAPPR
jgi:hypothetical protein